VWLEVDSAKIGPSCPTHQWVRQTVGWFSVYELMKKQLLISAMICILLVACNGQDNTATIYSSPSPTQKPVRTATSTPTKTPQPTLAPTSTITPLPFYENKKVLFNYYVIGDHSVYDGFFDPYSFRSYSRLVLYDDGQMIIPSDGEFGGTYKQKFLSPDEVKRFLSKLESLDFYSLESNQNHDPTDKLYDYGNNYQRSFDGREYCISVNADKSRKLCVYEPDVQFLIPKMKNILSYLAEYEPVGMTPYYPDRILLWIQSGRDPYNDKLPKASIAWDEHFPHLEDSIVYVDGDIAKEIYLLCGGTNQGKVFTQDNKEYTVYIDAVLPHEKVTNADQ
jgi:hypothetical protein